MPLPRASQSKAALCLSHMRWTSPALHTHPEPGTLAHRDWLVHQLCEAITVDKGIAVPPTWREDVRTMFQALSDVRDQATRVTQPQAQPKLCRCGHDRAACGVCGRGWAQPQSQAPQQAAGSPGSSIAGAADSGREAVLPVVSPAAGEVIKVIHIIVFVTCACCVIFKRQSQNRRINKSSMNGHLMGGEVGRDSPLQAHDPPSRPCRG